MPVARNEWQHVEAANPLAAAPLDHRQHRPPSQRLTAQPPRTVHALKEGCPRVLGAARGDVRFERLPGPVVDRHVVALAALLVQPQPGAHALPEVVLPPHPHRRAHPREAEDHHAEESPVAQPHQRPRVDPVHKRARLGRRQDRRRPLRDDVLRSPDRRGRVHGQHLVDDEPVAERPNGGQVLLDGRHRPRVRPDVGGDVERRDRPQIEAPLAAPGQNRPTARP